MYGINDSVGFFLLVLLNCNSYKTSFFNWFIARLFENKGSSNIT